MDENELRLREFYSNLKNWNFDVCGSYSVDENEAGRIMDAVKELVGIESDD